MSASQKTNSLRIWWILCPVTVCVALGLVCLLLFVPQSALLADARRQTQIVDERVGEVSRAPGIIEEIVTGLDTTQEFMGQANMLASGPVDQILVAAVADALEEVGGIELIALLPKKARKTAAAANGKASSTSQTPGADLWRLTCRGRLANVMALLNEVQSNGVLLNAAGFTLERKKTDFEVTVLLGVWSEQAFSRVAKRGAGK
ncbi:MAG: hypothetical protein HN742_09625 [Lentisphaerae bacterium]|jgi:hypothetical protein|nr:hypothetical protein [Lentisphaerota bacterium]MBT4817558.1 hypothetical protein [Lentisphaerota bacterium]MBT5610134.1 hypothetical protein [Lentisphaerota bacterium]MBT7057363.1 hypothetical protein [Lentisphaerota bacterium]MBT7842122.1 hypothetical protein [Lentisphaerota bacterium]